MPGEQEFNIGVLQDIANKLRIHSVTSTTAANSGYDIFLYL